MIMIIKRAGNFPAATTLFYSAEIVSALEYLHSLSIIYRYKQTNIIYRYKKTASTGTNNQTNKQTSYTSTINKIINTKGLVLFLKSSMTSPFHMFIEE